MATTSLAARWISTAASTCDTLHGRSRRASRLSEANRATCPVSLGTTGGRGSQIFGRVQDDREWFPLGRLAPSNAANIQLCKEHWPDRPPHAGSSPARTAAV